MPKLTLSDVTNLGGNPISAQQVINTNSDRIEEAMEKTLSRDGSTPNQMESDFDMNHYDVLNAGTVYGDKFVIDGVEFEGTALWIVSPGAPGTSVGKPGDIYLNSLTGDVYGPKTSSGWGSVSANIKGPQGIQGPQGVQGLQGIQGLQGMQGPQGLQGPQGVQGIRGEKGDSFSPNAIGLSSDRSTYDDEPQGFSFLDSQTGYLYFKLSGASGDWSPGITFTTGPQGPVGPQGVQGPEGPQGVEGPQGIQGPTGETAPTGIYNSKSDLESSEVPAEILAVRLNGYNTIGDGDGGLYIDTNNGSTDVISSDDGRSWYKVADVEAERVVQSPAYTRMTSRLLSDVLAGQPISPFHFGGNGLAVDQSDALQNALEFTLLDNTNPQSCTLDLVGRNWRTNKGLVIRDVPKTKRRITNGQLTAIGSYADEALLDIRPTANGGAGGSSANWVHALTIDHINFLGGSSQSNTLLQDTIALKNAHGIRIISCYLQWFNRYGIVDYTDRAATGVHIINSDIVGNYGNSEGIRLYGSDAEISGNKMISNCRRGIVLLNHSVNVENNHVYDCTEASIYYNDAAALCQGNYIDNAPIVIRTPRGLFTGNKFLRALTTPMGEGSAFIVLFPRVPTQFIQGFNFQGNSFANTAGGQVKMFAVDETEGSIGAVYSSIVDGNTVSSSTGTVLSQRSRPRGRVQISAANTGTLDLQSQLPFGHIKHAEVTWVKDAASSVIPAAAVTNISAADVVTVGLSQNATGLAYVRGDIAEFI